MFRKEGGLSCHLGDGGPSPLMSLSVTVARSRSLQLRGDSESTANFGCNINSGNIELHMKLHLAGLLSMERTSMVVVLMGRRLL